MMAAMTTQELADRFTAMLRRGENLQAVDEFYAPGIVSVEAMDFNGQGREQRGLEEVRGKNVWWFSVNEVHNAEVDGPFVSPERFALRFHFEFTNKESGQRQAFDEVAVYTVEGGKIVHEEFLYGPMG
jgi:hypothetical protein